jgi:hypothetical protein
MKNRLFSSLFSRLISAVVVDAVVLVVDGLAVLKT